MIDLQRRLTHNRSEYTKSLRKILNVVQTEITAIDDGSDVAGTSGTQWALVPLYAELAYRAGVISELTFLVESGVGQ